jgi:hypothetical protein
MLLAKPTHRVNLGDKFENYGENNHINIGASATPYGVNKEINL